MTDRKSGTVTSIYRYPVKGLAGEALDSANLAQGEALAFDRAWAIENGGGRFDPANPRHLPKINFLMLMRNEKLATLDAAFDEATQTLSVRRDGKQVAKGSLITPVGRNMLEQFFAAYMKDDLRGAPRIVSAPGHSFSDVASKCVHIVSLETVREIGRMAGAELDPLRFRANIYVEGMPAWSEFDWLDRNVTIGGCRMRVFARTERCEATNVDPATGTRDLSLPRLLERHLGHTDVGVYARVQAGGRIAVGDGVNAPS